jgi:hypothetical protein
MNIRYFKKLYNKNDELKNKNVDDLIELKNSIRKDIFNHFRKIHLREYQLKNHDKIKQQMREHNKIKYHTDKEYRDNKIKAVTNNYINKNPNKRLYTKFFELKLDLEN